MTPLIKLRALIDNMHKQQTPSTGGDGRMMEEVINTSAIAKGQALDRYKVTGVARTMPLRELQLKR
jgi:hypothetical protein